jgi:hypothetical protein
LTPVPVRPTCALSRPFVRDNLCNPNEEPMGSITIGNVTPATMTGPAMPKNIRIDRAGSCRVGSDGGA